MSSIMREGDDSEIAGWRLVGVVVTLVALMFLWAVSHA